MKLAPITILVIGLVIFFAAISYGASVALPNFDEAKKLEDNAAALKAEGDKMPKAKKRHANAEKALQAAANQWNEIALTKTPPGTLAEGGIDLNENAWQLVIDARTYRDNIQKAVNTQVKKGGIKVLSGPQIPFTSESATTVVSDFFNYPAIKFPVVIFDLGTIQVEGTYAQIMANVRSWANMPHYLAVADGLRIDGTSPKLHGTYSVSMIGYIRSKKVFPAVPEVGGGSSTASFGGAGGPPAAFGPPGVPGAGQGAGVPGTGGKHIPTPPSVSGPPGGGGGAKGAGGGD